MGGGKGKGRGEKDAPAALLRWALSARLEVYSAISRPEDTPRPKRRLSMESPIEPSTRAPRIVVSGCQT